MSVDREFIFFMVIPAAVAALIGWFLPLGWNGGLAVFFFLFSWVLVGYEGYLKNRNISIDKRLKILGAALVILYAGIGFGLMCIVKLITFVA